MSTEAIKGHLAAMFDEDQQVSMPAQAAPEAEGVSVKSTGPRVRGRDGGRAAVPRPAGGWRAIGTP